MSQFESSSESCLSAPPIRSAQSDHCTFPMEIVPCRYESVIDCQPAPSRICSSPRLRWRIRGCSFRADKLLTWVLTWPIKHVTCINNAASYSLPPGCFDFTFPRLAEQHVAASSSNKIGSTRFAVERNRIRARVVREGRGSYYVTAAMPCYYCTDLCFRPNLLSKSSITEPAATKPARVN